MTPLWWIALALVLAIALRVVWSGIKLMFKLAMIAAIALVAVAAHYGVFGRI